MMLYLSAAHLGSSMEACTRGCRFLLLLLHNLLCRCSFGPLLGCTPLQVGWRPTAHHKHAHLIAVAYLFGERLTSGSSMIKFGVTRYKYQSGIEAILKDSSLTSLCRTDALLQAWPWQRLYALF